MRSPYFCEEYIRTGNRIETCYRRKNHSGPHEPKKWAIMARNIEGHVTGVSFNEGTCIWNWLPVLVIKRHLFYFSFRTRKHRVHVVLGKDAVTPNCRGVSLDCRNIITGEKW